MNMSIVAINCSHLIHTDLLVHLEELLFSSFSDSEKNKRIDQSEPLMFLFWGGGLIYGFKLT